MTAETFAGRKKRRTEKSRAIKQYKRQKDLFSKKRRGEKISPCREKDGRCEEDKMLRNKLSRAKMLVDQKGLLSTAAHYIRKKIGQKAFLEEVRTYHIYPAETLKRQRETVFRNPPYISIVTPLYNTPREFLEELLISVQRQTYSNWELCLADGSDDAHKYVEECCEAYARKDSRIRYKRLPGNGGIVENTNRCLELCRGDYIGLLDHDDLLHPAALFEVAEELQQGADFVYTDEMKFKTIPEDSTDIVCKAGFGKDELRSHNYICHFVVFRKKLLEGMEQLYRRECEGSQDYDMVLRLTEKASRIVHIPRILYYWRVHQGSVSMDLSVKEYAVDAAKRAISDQLSRMREPGMITSNLPYQTIYRIRYERKDQPLVSLVLWGECRNRQTKQSLERILERTDYRPLEVVAAFEFEKARGIEEQTGFVYVKKEEQEDRYTWFNRAASCSRGEYLVYMHLSCIPETSDWVEELLMFAQRKDVCMVSPRIADKKKRIYFAGAVLDGEKEGWVHALNRGLLKGEEGYGANLKHVKNITSCSSVCMMISREKLLKMSGFRSETGDYGDVDMCLRGRKQGDWNIWTCFAGITYQGEGSVYAQWKDPGEFEILWKERLTEEDEYYHPFLKRLKRL